MSDKIAIEIKREHLPRNVEAEAGMLGALMIDNRHIPAVAERLKPEDFFEPLHGRIFRAICRFHEKGKIATPVSLRPILENDPALHELGGMSYLAMLTGNMAALIGVTDFAEQIQALSSRRQAIIAYAEGVERLCDTSGDVEDTLEIVDGVEDMTRIATARDHREITRTVHRATDSVRERAKMIDDGVLIGARCKTIPQLDDVIGLVERGTLNVLGGRPGQGKTSLAVSAALGYAANGFATEFFHLEMKGDTLDLRIVSDLSEMIGHPIRHEDIKKGRIGSDEHRTLARIDEIQDLLPIEFTEMKAGTDIRRIEAMIVRAKRKWERRHKKLWCVWIDYIQLVGAMSNGVPIEDDTKRVSAVCTYINQMKQKHDIAIFALAQLGRDVDKRPDKRPLMSDLKQSGKMEEDADSIFFAYRPEYYLEKDEPAKKEGADYDEWHAEYQASRDKMEIIGGKNRHGAPASRTAKFLKDYYAVRSPLRNYATDAALLQRDLFAETEEVTGEF